MQQNGVADGNSGSNSVENLSPRIRRQAQFDAGCIAACARRVYLLRMAHLRSRFFPYFYRRRYVPNYLACRNGCIISMYHQEYTSSNCMLHDMELINVWEEIERLCHVNCITMVFSYRTPSTISWSSGSSYYPSCCSRYD